MLPSQTETYLLTDPAFLEDPYPVYHRMRQQDPVYWSEALGHWVLTRYDNVLAATRNPAPACCWAPVISPRWTNSATPSWPC